MSRGPGVPPFPTRVDIPEPSTPPISIPSPHTPPPPDHDVAHNEPDEVVEVVPEDVPGEAVEPPSALDQDEPCSAFTELESTEPPKDVEAVADLDDTADNTAANLTSTHLHPPPSEVLMDTAAAIPTTTDGRDSKEVLVKAAPKPPSRLWRPRRLSQMAQPVEPPTEPTKRLRTAKASVGRFFRQREQASKEMVKAGRCTEEATLPATTAGARITAAKSRSRPRAKELAQAMERPSTVELVHHTQEEGHALASQAE
eukprot:s2077_g4.t1